MKTMGYKEWRGRWGEPEYTLVRALNTPIQKCFDLMNDDWVLYPDYALEALMGDDPSHVMVILAAETSQEGIESDLST
jgi:hypothetical protein